jgi:hypothetical protein
MRLPQTSCQICLLNIVYTNQLTQQRTQHTQDFDCVLCRQETHAPPFTHHQLPVYYTACGNSPLLTVADVACRGGRSLGCDAHAWPVVHTQGTAHILCMQCRRSWPYCRAVTARRPWSSFTELRGLWCCISNATCMLRSTAHW